MANAQSGGDVSQRGPGEYLDPLAPLASQFQQLTSAMELVFDDIEEFLQGVNDDVLALQPDERFTQSHDVLREHLEARFGSPDAFASLLPESDPEKLPAVLEQIIETLLTDVLEGVLFQRDPEAHLVMAALFQTLNHGVRRLTAADEQEVKDRTASTVLALLSRLQRILTDAPETLPEEAIWDILYGLHHLTANEDDADFPNPGELSFDEAKQEVVEFGAVIAYARLDVSLSRGAELAGVSPEAFRADLERFDVEPRVGPDSVEELYEDVIDE